MSKPTINAIKLFLCMEAMWYFVWYGRSIKNGELLAGCFAALFFGYTLVYATYTATDFFNKRLVSGFMSLILTMTFAYFFVEDLKTLANIWAGDVVTPYFANISTPFDISVHLVIPLWFCIIVSIILVSHWLFKLCDDWTYRKTYNKDDYYAGKVFIDNVFKEKKDAL